MKNKIILSSIFFVGFVAFYIPVANAQAILNADGPGNTYELIDSILAQGKIAVEAPDQCANHPEFGRHIAEVWDDELKQYVFEFYIHATPDNDRCEKSDRQRVEIKSFSSSPDSLKGTNGEKVVYNWKFRLPKDFMPSTRFTHIHQVKAVGGDSGEPIFTLTPRFLKKGNSMQVIYTADSNTKFKVLAEVPLTDFLGEWVSVTENISIRKHGSYYIRITRMRDDKEIFQFKSNRIQTIRSSNTFIRPKWGLYRSILKPLEIKDETIRISNISIKELNSTKQGHEK